MATIVLASLALLMLALLVYVSTAPDDAPGADEDIDAVVARCRRLLHDSDSF